MNKCMGAFLLSASLIAGEKAAAQQERAAPDLLTDTLYTKAWSSNPAVYFRLGLDEDGNHFLDEEEVTYYATKFAYGRSDITLFMDKNITDSTQIHCLVTLDKNLLLDPHGIDRNDDVFTAGDLEVLKNFADTTQERAEDIFAIHGVFENTLALGKAQELCRDIVDITHRHGTANMAAKFAALAIARDGHMDVVEFPRLPKEGQFESAKVTLPSAALATLSFKP